MSIIKQSTTSQANGDSPKSAWAQKSARTTSIFKLVLLATTVLLSLFAAEITARIAGYRPWQVKPPDIRVEPGGTFYFPHSSLGYTHLPGEFRIILQNSYVFKVSNLNNPWRITHRPEPNSTTPERPEIWIFGDSITYGWSVNDEETYPWLLQQNHPAYEFVNFGVNGYGTLQSLIQLEEAFKTRRRPKLVILTYASWLDVRNTLLRGRGKMLAAQESLGRINRPYARLNSNGTLDKQVETAAYREFPLMRYSAFVNMVEEAYGRYEERHAYSHEVTKLIIKEFAEVCRKNGSALLIASLTDDPTTSDILQFCHVQGIPTVNMFVDLMLKENNNLPFDSHPSAIAHRRYAKSISSYLTQFIR